MALGKFGKYQKLDVLGHGGYGIVYLAQDTFLNRKIALKEIEVKHQANRDKYLQEALIQATLSHPNIVTIHNAGEEGNKLFIDMELLDTDLEKVLKKERTLPVDRAVNIATQILEGLAEAHSKHVVHRDIKPNNILFRQASLVKIGDFGKAHTLATGEYINGAGIPDYMAPEALMSEAKCDYRSDICSIFALFHFLRYKHADRQHYFPISFSKKCKDTDIWSVGVVLYEMLTGHLPFEISHHVERIMRRQTLEQRRPPALKNYCSYNTEYLQATIDRALQPDKHKRYTSAQEFISTLKRISEQPRQTIAHSFAEGLTLEVIQRAWPRILRLVEKEGPAGIPWLKQATVTGLDGNNVLLTFKDVFARDRINIPRGRELLDRKLNAALQTTGYRIQCLLDTPLSLPTQVSNQPSRNFDYQVPPVPPISKEGMLKEVLDIFGGEVINAPNPD